MAYRNRARPPKATERGVWYAVVCSAVLAAVIGCSDEVTHSPGPNGTGGASGGGGDGAGGEGGSGGDPGDSVGSFVLTYYWFLYEDDYEGEPNTALPGSNCTPVATVKKGFADDVCLEGSGRTIDDIGINLTGECDCGYSCPGEAAKVCFFTYDLETAPWGMGSAGNALEPLRSIAMNVEALRSKTVYLPPFDGFLVPAERGVGNFVHDGCFRVDDESYSFEEEGLDVFIGPKALLGPFEAVHGSTVSIEARAGGSRCAHLER